MRQFLYRVSGALARFMYGRNGTDQLNMALLCAYLAALVLAALLGRISPVRVLLEAVTVALAVLVLFRTFSRNLSKRQAENERFLAWWRPVKQRITGARQRRRDKDHKYFTCKNCRTICRVPTGKGKIEITCPKCGGKIIGKS